MKIDLNNKVALVTASSRGIGFGIAKTFLETGAKVCLNGRDSASLESAMSSLGGPSSRLTMLAGDIGDAGFLESLVKHVESKFGSIDILANNNGGPPPGPALSFSEEDWQAALNRNLLSVIRLSQLVVENMKKKKWGRIINLTSTVAKEVDPGMVLSAVTRAGVSAYSKSLAQELGPFGITVNTILTGGCLTERLESLIKKDIEGSGEDVETAIRRVSKAIPVGYIPKPEEFSKIILFLASDFAGFVSGTSIPVDGAVTKSVF